MPRLLIHCTQPGGLLAVQAVEEFPRRIAQVEERRDQSETRKPLAFEASGPCQTLIHTTGTLRTEADGAPPITLSAERGSRTSLVAREVGKPETLHVILEVRDAGTPPLWAYRRAVITIQP